MTPRPTLGLVLVECVSVKGIPDKCGGKNAIGQALVMGFCIVTIKIKKLYKMCSSASSINLTNYVITVT